MKGLPTVVLTNATFPETRAMFDGIARLVANDGAEPWNPHTLDVNCREATALMAFMTDRIDGAFLDRCPNLKVIGAALKGYDNIDVDAATARGVWITICNDLLTVPTAELAIALMLALGRNILAADREIRETGFRGWRPRHYGVGLDGAAVGIIGFGKVGQAIAERLLGFRCRLSAHDQMASEVPRHLSGRVAMTSLEHLLRTSDFVVLALPLLPSTMHIIDAPAIAAMRTGTLLVNPARGSLVDEAAVAASIASGHLGGYAADVFECEDWARADRPPAIDGRLLETGARTVLTPHIGSAVARTRREIEASAARSIIQVLNGETPAGAINFPNNKG